MPKRDFSGSERGQVLLMVVLVLVVGLVVGLSLVTRTLTNIRISTEEENSQRAFSAAEAGIEQLLKSGNPSLTNNLSNQTTFTATNNPSCQATSQCLINNGNVILKDDGIDLWLVDHNADGSINFSSGWQTLPASPLGYRNVSFHWGNSADVCNPTPNLNTMAALEIIVVTGTSASPQTTRYGADPCNGRRGTNNLSNPDNRPFSMGGVTFQYEYTININDASRGIVIRVVPLYAKTILGVRACQNNGVGGGNCTNLPSQGSNIESIGSDISSNTARKIAVFQGFPKLPNEFFQYTLLVP